MSMFFVEKSNHFDVPLIHATREEMEQLRRGGPVEALQVSMTGSRKGQKSILKCRSCESNFVRPAEVAFTLLT